MAYVQTLASIGIDNIWNSGILLLTEEVRFITTVKCETLTARELYSSRILLGAKYGSSV